MSFNNLFSNPLNEFNIKNLPDIKKDWVKKIKEKVRVFKQLTKYSSLKTLGDLKLPNHFIEYRYIDYKPLKEIGGSTTKIISDKFTKDLTINTRGIFGYPFLNHPSIIDIPQKGTSIIKGWGLVDDKKWILIEISCLSKLKKALKHTSNIHSYEEPNIFLSVESIKITEKNLEDLCSLKQEGLNEFDEFCGDFGENIWATISKITFKMYKNYQKGLKNIEETLLNFYKEDLALSSLMAEPFRKELERAYEDEEK